MVQTKNLTFRYPGSEPISFPDFKVEAGKPLLICGESGCGKTTLLHILAGLRIPAGGQVIIDDTAISELPSSKLDQFRGQNIGIVYQQSYFIESLNILDNLLLSPFALDRKKASTVTERLNIGDLVLRYPNQLSVGQLQRASIARAVMNGPKLILADEPTSALDNSNSEQVVDLLIEEATTNNAALIIVTHDDRLRSKIDACIDLNSLVN